MNWKELRLLLHRIPQDQLEEPAVMLDQQTGDLVEIMKLEQGSETYIVTEDTWDTQQQSPPQQRTKKVLNGVRHGYH